MTRQYVALSADAFNHAMQYRPYVIEESVYVLILARLVHDFSTDLTTPLEQYEYMTGDFLDWLENYLFTVGYPIEKLWRLEITPSTFIEGISRSLTVMYPYLEPTIKMFPGADTFNLVDYSPTGLVLEAYYGEYAVG